MTTPFAWIALWLLGLLAPPQELHARTELFVRPAPAEAGGNEGVVRAALRVRCDPGWHFYHAELGQPDAVGKPTKVTFESTAEGGADWSPVRFPEPYKIEQPGIGEDGRDTWIWGHEGTVVLYAAGRFADAASAAAGMEKAVAKIDGLTCEDGGQCTQWKVSAPSKGAGPDALFASFPSDLTAPGLSAPDLAELGTSTAGGAATSGPDKGSNPYGVVGFGAFGSSSKARAELFVRQEGERVDAVVEVKVDPGWHLYGNPLGASDAVGLPTTVELNGADVAWEAPVFPPAVRQEQPGLGKDGADTWIWTYAGTFAVRVQGRAAAGADLSKVVAKLAGQTCDEGSTCINWSASAPNAGRGRDELFAAAAASAGANAAGGTGSGSGDASRGPTSQSTLGQFLWSAVFWALFTLLMPCTYPMIPITISFFTKQASARGGKATSLSLMYGLGIVASFIVIGVAFGSVIIPFATHPLTNLVIGLAFVFFSLTLFGAINLQPPAALMQAAGQASRRGGLVGVFLMGATLVVTSFTCTAPFVGTLLATGAQDGDLVRIVLGMGTFGLTMAIPFVLLSLLPGKAQALPRSGEWMHVLKVFLGFVELAAALKFLSNTDIVWRWGVLNRELFLVLWFGIFLVAAAFLFGLIRLKGEEAHEIGPLRMVGATLVFLFALYCLYGSTGRALDKIMTAFVPNYSGQWVEGATQARAGIPKKGAVVVKDDYAKALELASEQKKLLLVNFTGFV